MIIDQQLYQSIVSIIDQQSYQSVAFNISYHSASLKECHNVDKTTCHIMAKWEKQEEEEEKEEEEEEHLNLQFMLFL